MTAVAERITELEGKLDQRRNFAKEVFEQAGEKVDMSKVTLLEGNSTAKVDGLRALNEEMAFLGSELSSARREQHEAEKAAAAEAEPIDHGRAMLGRGRPQDEAPKSVGEIFVASDAYKNRPARGSMGVGPHSVLETGGLQATLFQRTAGFAPESLRTGRVVEFALRPIQVTDLFSEAETTMAAVVYMEETTATSAAAERAEAAVYAESTLVYTQRSRTVESVGNSIPVTDEQLADVAQARSLLDGRLSFFVKQRLDGQLINGDGNTPNLLGILNASGLQTQAKAADPTPDAFFKAMQKIRLTGRAHPSAALLHQNDWTPVRLLRTADGIYIWGSPSDPGPEFLWGLQVVQTDTLSAGTGLVGDFSPAMVQLYVRAGLEVQVGYVNDDFLKGKQTIRAGVRVANVIYRGAAFCTVTGL